MLLASFISLLARHFKQYACMVHLLRLRRVNHYSGKVNSLIGTSAQIRDNICLICSVTVQKGGLRAGSLSRSPFFTITDAPGSKSGRFFEAVNGFGGYLPLIREVKRGARPSPSKERGTTGVRLISNQIPFTWSLFSEYGNAHRLCPCQTQQRGIAWLPAYLPLPI